MKQLGGRELLDLRTAAGAGAPLLLDVREPWEFALAAIHIDGLRTLVRDLG